MELIISFIIALCISEVFSGKETRKGRDDY